MPEPTPAPAKKKMFDAATSLEDVLRNFDARLKRLEADAGIAAQPPPTGSIDLP